MRVVMLAVSLGLGCVPAQPTGDEREPVIARPASDQREPSVPTAAPVRTPEPPHVEPPTRAEPPQPAPLLRDPREERARQVEHLKQVPRYMPEVLLQPPRPTRIAPGMYLCKISKEYRLRDCSVERDAKGYMILTMPDALIAVRGVLWDEGKVVKFAGWTTQEWPFGCFACQERCFVDPEQCGCSEHQIEGSRECLAQPVRFALRGGPKVYKGTLEYRMYFNDYKGEGPERRVVGYGSEIDRFEVELHGPPR